MTIASAILEKSGKPDNGQTIEEAIRDSAIGYDLRITIGADGSNNRNWADWKNNPNLSQVVIAAGGIEACEEKVNSGEGISAVLYFFLNTGYGMTVSRCQLGNLSISYKQLTFFERTTTINVYYNSNYEITNVG